MDWRFLSFPMETMVIMENGQTKTRIKYAKCFIDTYVIFNLTFFYRFQANPNWKQLNQLIRCQRIGTKGYNQGSANEDLSFRLEVRNKGQGASFEDAG